MDHERAAAFYRVEGALTRRPTLAAAAYICANAQRLSERMTRLGNVALAAPFALRSDVAGVLGARLSWMSLRGIGEDRIVVLAAEYYERFLEPSLLDVGLGLVAESRRQKKRVVLITDNIDLVMRPLVERLGADDLVCNRLEMTSGRATGRLIEPVVGGALSGQWARAFADANHIDLLQSSAYGARQGDGLLMSAIGQPCAVNPDRQLRRMARDHDWPVIER